MDTSQVLWVEASEIAQDATPDQGQGTKKGSRSARVDFWIVRGVVAALNGSPRIALLGALKGCQRVVLDLPCRSHDSPVVLLVVFGGRVLPVGIEGVKVEVVELAPVSLA